MWNVHICVTRHIHLELGCFGPVGPVFTIKWPTDQFFNTHTKKKNLSRIPPSPNKLNRFQSFPTHPPSAMNNNPLTAISSIYSICGSGGSVWPLPMCAHGQLPPPPPSSPPPPQNSKMATGVSCAIDDCCARRHIPS